MEFVPYNRFENVEFITEKGFINPFGIGKEKRL